LKIFAWTCQYGRYDRAGVVRLLVAIGFLADRSMVELFVGVERVNCDICKERTMLDGGFAVYIPSGANANGSKGELKVIRRDSRSDSP
jgi:hypothetical protein